MIKTPPLAVLTNISLGYGYNDPLYPETQELTVSIVSINIETFANYTQVQQPESVRYKTKELTHGYARTDRDKKKKM